MPRGTDLVASVPYDAIPYYYSGDSRSPSPALIRDHHRQVRGAATRPDSSSPTRDLDGTKVYSELPGDRHDMSPAVRTYIKRPRSPQAGANGQFVVRVGGGWEYSPGRHQPKPKPKPKPKIIERIVYVDKPVEVVVEKKVKVPVDRVVEVKVPPEIVERIVYVDKPVEVLVEKKVEVPVDRIVEVETIVCQKPDCPDCPMLRKVLYVAIGWAIGVATGWTARGEDCEATAEDGSWDSLTLLFTGSKIAAGE
jgi:hypothetical protein